ncbi:MAG: hypothetical protein FAF03_01840 [Epsilonproteobacteria bacterium]|nr:hypothetical protein [Campylobacterota bacterium]
MTPEYKFQAYVTGFTVSIMYIVITEIIPMFDDIKSWSEYIKPLVTLASTAVVYQTLSKSLLVLARNFNWLKKHLLGVQYLNGTWVGKFTVANDEPIFTVETFEQTLSALHISGEAFDMKGSTYAQWESVAVSIDKGVLTYTYSCRRNEENFSFEGIGVFKLDGNPPTYLRGFSADLTDGGKRNENREKKVSDKLLTFDEALELAKKECS